LPFGRNFFNCLWRFWTEMKIILEFLCHNFCFILNCASAGETKVSRKTFFCLHFELFPCLHFCSRFSLFYFMFSNNIWYWFWCGSKWREKLLTLNPKLVCSLEPDRDQILTKKSPKNILLRLRSWKSTYLIHVMYVHMHILCHAYM
jgi:hypothetical protein